MVEQPFGRTYAGNPPANYERFFVPAIGAPLADDLVRHASLKPGEHVLDAACGTGVVARLAAREVGPTGSVSGLDIEPGMLAVAGAATPPGLSIDWREAGAEAMPFPDASFDAVLCQMGLQFMPDKHAALREMRRVLAHDGRLIFNVPGPAPRPIGIMGEAFARNIDPEAGGFVNLVFALHDTAQIQNLLTEAGFRDVSVESYTRQLCLPAPKEFLWQYVHSTPLAGLVARADDKALSSLERQVVEGWQEFVEDGALVLPLRMVMATARK